MDAVRLVTKRALEVASLYSLENSHVSRDGSYELTLVYALPLKNLVRQAHAFSHVNTRHVCRVYMQAALRDSA